MFDNVLLSSKKIQKIDLKKSYFDVFDEFHKLTIAEVPIWVRITFWFMIDSHIKLKNQKLYWVIMRMRKENMYIILITAWIVCQNFSKTFVPILH